MPVAAHELPKEKRSLFSQSTPSWSDSNGAEAATVELHATSSVFRAMLVNGKMNDAPTAGRENEASAIRSIVSQAIAGKPEFKRIAVIRVEYLVRSHQNAKPKVVDLIEFRKDASGRFRHHVT